MSSNRRSIEADPVQEPDYDRYGNHSISSIIDSIEMTLSESDAAIHIDGLCDDLESQLEDMFNE